METEIIHLLNFPTILFFLTIAFQAGGTIYMLVEHGRQIKEIKKDQAEFKKDMAQRLYDSQSQSIYMPRVGCADARESCEKARQKEFDYLAVSIRDHGKKVNQLIILFKQILKRNRRKEDENGR